jgi:hypothetical protein
LLLQNFASTKAQVMILDAKGTLVQKRTLKLTQITITDFDLKDKAPGPCFIRVAGIVVMKLLHKCKRICKFNIPFDVSILFPSISLIKRFLMKIFLPVCSSFFKTLLQASSAPSIKSIDKRLVNVPGVKTISLRLSTLCILVFITVSTFQTSAQAPTITNSSPDSGPVGSTVVITGTNFSPIAENNTVYIGGVKAVVTAATTTSLAVTAPTGATDTNRPLSVTVNGLTAYSSTPFVVTFPCSNPTLSFTKTNFNVGTPQAIADIDGDGKGDFIGGPPGSVSIRRNLSVGEALAFAPAVAFPTGTSTYGNNVTTADLDGDGKLDLAAVVSYDSRTIALLRNTSSIGSISFAPKVDVPVPGSPKTVAIGDLNGDGKPDLAIHNPSSTGPTGTVSVFLNMSTVGTLSFANKVDFPTEGNFSDAYIADFDGDGKQDMAFLDYVHWSFSVLRNTSTGGSLSFAAGGSYPVASSPRSLAIADLDRDGKPDVVTAGGQNPNYYFTVARNTSTPGTISFADGGSYGAAGIYASAPIIGDLNGDGKPELVVTSVTGDNCSRDSSLITIFENTSIAGSLSFRYAKTLSFAGCSASLGPIVDLNGDSKSDLLINDVVYKNETVCTSPCSPNNLPTFVNNGLIILDATCANNDGNINIIPTRGTAPFMYSINGGTTYVKGPDAGYGFQNLPSGTYKLRLKDANGCESAIVEREVKLNCTTTCTPPTFVNNGLIILDATCANNDGNINIIPTSGTAPFMYSINGGVTYVAGPNAGYGFQNLPSGTYKLRLKDAKGCESAIVEREVKLLCATTCTPPTFVNNNLIVLDASCGKSDGAINIIPTSGTAPFMYSINGGTTYVAGPNAGYGFQNLPAGTYQLRLKDARGCQSAIVERTVRNYYNCPGITTSKNIFEEPLALSNKDVVATYPNPNHGQFKLLLQNFKSTKAEVMILDAKGIVLQKRTLNLTQNTIADFGLEGKAPGLYLIKVVSAGGTVVTRVLIQ